MDFASLLTPKPCSCGKTHRCAIRAVYVEKGALSRLPELCRNYEKILLVADENTYAAAGEEAARLLGARVADRVVFSGKTLVIPNEAAIEAIEEKLDGKDLILGVGSGVVQDLAKYVSHERGVPYFVAATAPSMDGYASTGAAMILGGMKVTVPAGVPEVLVADTAVLKNAPMEMIRAGYGDILGKYSALNDWRLANLVYGEELCPEIYRLTEDMIRKTIPLAADLLARKEEAVGTLMEALVAVGIAMSFAGSSRPASGSEHHLSHFFEITGIVHDRPYLPHGVDVAFSTYVTAGLRRELLKADFPAASPAEGLEDTRLKLLSVYGPVAIGCLSLQHRVGRYEEDRLPVYRAKADGIRKILAECPAPEEIDRLLLAVGLDRKEFYRTYTPAQLFDAVRYAKDLKDRYTVLWAYRDVFGENHLPEVLQ